MKQSEIAVICSWCKKLISGTPKEDGSNVSHTICTACSAKLYPEEEEDGNDT